MELLKKIKTSQEQISSLQNELASAGNFLKWGTGPSSADIEVKFVNVGNGADSNYLGEVSKKT